MNADVAKPIHHGLVYSEMVIDRDQPLAALRPFQEHFVATMSPQAHDPLVNHVAPQNQ
jgi:hypothetical protein